VNAPIVIKGFIIEIEQDLLGVLLTGADCRRVTSFLRPDHFVEPLHRFLFDQMVLATERYGSTSPVVLLKLISADAALAWETKLGKSLSHYLANLAANCMSGAANLERAARKVIEQWARITLGDEADRLRAAASDPAANPSDLVGGMSSALDTISSDLRVGGRRETRFSIERASEIALTEIQEAMSSGAGLTGITWGLVDVNRATGGMHRGEMVVIGARPSMGKTAVAGSIALRAAKSGAGVAFISLEMSSSKIAMRALTDLAYDRNKQIAYSDLITGRIDETTYEAIISAKRELAGVPLIFEEQGGLTVSELRVKIERIADELRHQGKTLDVLIVDYLQLIQPSGRYSGNRTNEIAEVSAALRNFGREYGCAVIALSQLSRGVESREDKRPMLSDLRDSGSIEQDADAVIFLFREAYYLEKAKGKDGDKEAERIGRLIDVQNKLEFAIAKQRNGPVKTIDLFVDIASSAVRNAVAYQ